ncbi:MAG: pseudouridylate synthase [Flammeovirgaceae bacterium]|nr:pseudouridylate synthase [Flammeovirgaceae bacterium]
MSIPLEILYQDDFLVAINKPSGLLVHKSDLDKYEVNNAMEMLRDQLGRWVYPIHRLDKPTSGVLLFGLDSITAKLLTEIFTKRDVAKSYLAVVRGHAPTESIIDYSLPPLFTNKPKQTVPKQTAITHYKRLKTTEVSIPVRPYPTSRYSLLQISPQTGRTRQIRRHMKHIFHPIIGDTAHGDGKHNQMFREKFDCHRLLLHAESLQFRHPKLDSEITIEASLDQSFKKIISQLKFD